MMMMIRCVIYSYVYKLSICAHIHKYTGKWHDTHFRSLSLSLSSNRKGKCNVWRKRIVYFLLTLMIPSSKTMRRRMMGRHFIWEFLLFPFLFTLRRRKKAHRSHHYLLSLLIMMMLLEDMHVCLCNPYNHTNDARKVCTTDNLERKHQVKLCWCDHDIDEDDGVDLISVTRR